MTKTDRPPPLKKKSLRKLTSRVGVFKMDKHSQVFFCNNTFLEKHTTPAKTKSHKYAKSEAQPKKKITPGWARFLQQRNEPPAVAAKPCLWLSMNHEIKINISFLSSPTTSPHSDCSAAVGRWWWCEVCQPRRQNFEGSLKVFWVTQCLVEVFFYAILGYFCLFRVIGLCYDVVVQNVIE